MNAKSWLVVLLMTLIITSLMGSVIYANDKNKKASFSEYFDGPPQGNDIKCFDGCREKGHACGFNGIIKRHIGLIMKKDLKFATDPSKDGCFCFDVAEKQKTSK